MFDIEIRILLRQWCVSNEWLSVSGAQTPHVNVTFKEIAEDPRHPGLFTVNVTWTHPNGMQLYVCTVVCLSEKLKLCLMLLRYSSLYVAMYLLVGYAMCTQVYCIIHVINY